MSPDNKQQTMKPITAANKLGIYLPAAPDEFQNSMPSRADVDALRENPPEWLLELRKNGPHPRDVVAKKLGISIAGLGRADMKDALTEAQIDELIADPPAWLIRERTTHAEVRKEAERVKAKAAERIASTNRPTKLRNL